MRALIRLSSGAFITGIAGAGVYLSSDGGASWNQANSGLADLNVTALAAASDGSAIYAGTLTGGVFKSTDGGASWTPAGDGIDPHIHSLSVDPADPQVLTARTDKGLYKTGDGGLHWRPVPVADFTTALDADRTQPPRSYEREYVRRRRRSR